MAFPLETTPDRPDFALRLGGRDADARLRLDVLEIDVAEEVGRHGRATLLVRNWDPDVQRTRHLDAGTFAPGTEVELSLGWASVLEPVFAGVVTEVRARFAGDAGPTLEVGCRSRSVLLAALPRVRVFADASDGDVAGDLAALYGLTVAAEDGVRQEQVVVAGRSDWDWLVGRAERLGFVTYVRDRELVFRPPAAPTGDEPAVEYGTSLRELTLTEDLAGRASAVTVAGWSDELEPATGEADGGRAEPPTDGRPGPGKVLDDAGWPVREAFRGTAAGITADEADRRAVAEASADVLRHVSGTGVTLGLPGLRADGWLRISGVGDRLGGLHYLTAVRHRLGRRGFTTEFQVGRPAPLRPPAAEPGPPDGLVLGVVEEIGEQGRVKVAFPWAATEREPVWARRAVPDAGPGQGAWFVPDPGQEVLVGFVDGDRRFPVVLGALWNAKQEPPEQADPDANALRGLVSRSGHRLMFDDSEPGVVRLTTAGGHELVLDDDAGTVTLGEQGGSASIVLGPDGVALTAQQGDLTLSAPAGAVRIDAARVQAKATGPATVQSGASLELKATAALSVSGALVKIN